MIKEQEVIIDKKTLLAIFNYLGQQQFKDENKYRSKLHGLL